jgi:hypothetical protein
MSGHSLNVPQKTASDPEAAILWQSTRPVSKTGAPLAILKRSQENHNDQVD